MQSLLQSLKPLTWILSWFVVMRRNLIELHHMYVKVRCTLQSSIMALKIYAKSHSGCLPQSHAKILSIFSMLLPLGASSVWQFWLIWQRQTHLLVFWISALTSTTFTSLSLLVLICSPSSFSFLLWQLENFWSSSSTLRHQRYLLHSTWEKLELWLDDGQVFVKLSAVISVFERRKLKRQCSSRNCPRSSSSASFKSEPIQKKNKKETSQNDEWQWRKKEFLMNEKHIWYFLIYRDTNEYAYYCSCFRFLPK